MKKILVVSYFPNNDSGSMNLWTKDKILSLVELGFEVDLITSPLTVNRQNSRTFYVYSINPSTYWNEIKAGYAKPTLPWILLVYTFGLVHELLERLVLRRIGHGMWGWTIPTFFKIIALRRKRNYDSILSLGGPTSAHLANVLVSMVSKSRTIIEFQDPIVGDDIGHNKTSSFLFKFLEKFLITSDCKIVFVTRTSALECQSRFPLASNIHNVYSSSRMELLKSNSNVLTSNNDLNFRLAYFGEMYSTRNYNSLLMALKKLNEKNMDNKFEVCHYGNAIKINLIGLDNIVKFNFKSNITRENAMNEALKYDLLLIVQHTDNRSKLTIPYKTWDYLNLQKPILALLNNDELKMLLDSLGHYTCDVNDVDSIVNAILRFANDLKEEKVEILPNPYDIKEQVLELLS
jgi:hypothetical protein